MFIRPVFKCPGGKRYLYKWIISHFPQNYEEMTYIEPCGGAASVLLNKMPSKKEIYNDFNEGIFNIFNEIKNNKDNFTNSLKSIKYTEENFNFYKNLIPTDSLEKSIKELVLRRMSRGGFKKDFGWSERLRNGVPGDVNAWNTFIDHFPLICDRLKDVQILNANVKDVIENNNDENILCYVDPPYLHSTRTSNDLYEVEMNEEQHVELSKQLVNSKSKIVLSGYYSPLYSKLYKNWKMSAKEMPNHCSQSKTKERRIEVIWKNF